MNIIQNHVMVKKLQEHHISMLQQNKIFTICIINIVVLIVCVILSVLLLKKKDLIVTGD